jgi:hypothetical protein
MKGISVARAFAGLALVAGLNAGTGSAALAAPTTFQYTFTNHNQNASFIDTGICDPGPAAIMLIGFNEVIHVSATQSGLTEAEIRALLDEEDPNGVLIRVTYTQTGQFIVEEASGVTYTGRFTSWFGGNVNGHTAEFGGTFSVRGTGDDGSRVTGNMTSHVTFVGGEPVVEFDKGHIRGCAA